MSWNLLDPVGDALEFERACAGEPGFSDWWRSVARDGVVPKERFLPEDLRGWIGRLAVLAIAEDRSVGVRLWGEKLKHLSEMDLTGAIISYHPQFGAVAEGALRLAGSSGIVAAQTRSAGKQHAMVDWLLFSIDDGRIVALVRSSEINPPE